MDEGGDLHAGMSWTVVGWELPRAAEISYAARNTGPLAILNLLCLLPVCLALQETTPLAPACLLRVKANGSVRRKSQNR